MRSRSQAKAVNIPVEDNKPEIEIAVPPDSNPAVAAYQKEVEKADEAANALRVQLDALRTSEQIQRQRFEHEQQQRLMRAARLQEMRPATREEKVQAWKEAGLSAQNEAFMWEHPELIDHHEITRVATQEALASGARPDSDDFRHAVKANFDTAMRHLKAQAEVEHGPSPAFFSPPPPKPTPEPATVRSALVSAPISREVPDGNRAFSVPTRISLSPDEVAIAKASGITERQYAENKLRMMRMKQTGEIQT
jgi:hypothetical protein